MKDRELFYELNRKKLEKENLKRITKMKNFKKEHMYKKINNVFNESF